MMPVMDGTNLTRVLLRINPAIKIVTSSGFAASFTTNSFSEAGGRYFLAKPYTAETLLKTIRDILDEA
jgi:CheY-like chemotaxis protein